jgi:hypothetical protein
MRRRIAACCLPVVVLVLPACAEPDPHSTGPCSLAPNSLAPNSLAPNALSADSLDKAALDTLKSSSPDGEHLRDLVKYAVSCALDETQSFSFSFSDATGTHEETYRGRLGIAPSWATEPLSDETQQRLVSACLAARTNWYGKSVTISLRSSEKPLPAETGAMERAAYSNIEGAFWGNLFAASPYLYACYAGSGPDLARAELRDCAAGHVDESGATVPCGMIQLAGPCSAVCDGFDAADGYYPSCEDHPDQANSPSTEAVITTGLHPLGAPDEPDPGCERFAE